MRLVVCSLCILIVGSLSSYAQQSGAPIAGSVPIQGGETAANSGVVQDTMKNMGAGQSAEDALTNAANTNAHSGLSKDLPTANSNSTVVQDTMKNMGAGQSAEDALTNAAQSAATNAGKSAAAPTR